MKNFFTSVSLKVKVLVLTIIAGLVSSPVFAQVNDVVGNQILNSTQQGLQGIVPGVTRILKIVVLIGGAISAILVVFNIIQGERDSAKKAGWWLVGLVVGFIVLTILGNMQVS